MFKVYWTEGDTPRDELFGNDKLNDALNKCESLRLRRLNGEPISFVSLCSEDLPGNATKAGVAPAPPGYEWKKRR